MNALSDQRSEGVVCRTFDARHATDGCRLVGYARSFDHPEAIAAQLAAFNALGCDTIFSDDAKGAAIGRPGFAAALAVLQPGDCLVVMSLERLAWRHDLLLEIAASLAARGVHLWALDDEFDTRCDGGAFGLLMALHGFSDSVRQARIDETMAADPRFKVSNAAIAAVEARIARGEITVTQGATALGVHRSTFYRRRAAA